ncbi:hypothetical protein Lalb_Chr06g0172811 [Lupinus albus]|uniref:Uncharacterized protein n=1 Tax=Lupinus albus TaxID=3870 RepID=A0A6A4QFK3_LUPAL|nr:hypothetical protein Lalb_Chr06g0172811 [Lupinus albus]
MVHTFIVVASAKAHQSCFRNRNFGFHFICSQSKGLMWFWELNGFVLWDRLYQIFLFLLCNSLWTTIRLPSLGKTPTTFNTQHFINSLDSYKQTTLPHFMPLPLYPPSPLQYRQTLKQQTTFTPKSHP